MKHWYRTLAVKIICFILCILSLVLTVACVFTAVGMIATEIYVNPEETTVENLDRELVRRNVYDIVFRSLAENGNHKQTLMLDYAQGNTNLRFKLMSLGSNAVISTNGFSAKDATRIYDFYCDAVVYQNGEVDLDIIHENSMDRVDYILSAYIEQDVPVYDGFAFVRDVISVAYALKYWIYAIALLSFGLFIATFIMLMCTSGRRPASDRVHPGMMTFVPIDILITMSVFISLFGFHLIFDLFYTVEAATVAIIVWSVVCANIVLGLCMSIACRMKQRTLFSGTFIWWTLKFIYGILKVVVLGTGKFFKAAFRLIRRIPLVWKTALAVAVNLFIDMLLIFLALDWYYYAEMYLILFMIKSIIIGAAVLYIALSMRTLQKGGEAIAKGDLTYRVDTERMLWDFKRHGENLNSISDGMISAVEHKLQSERTKTELITNVSHDIKTPLTSIINYANLISEEADPDKAKEYSGVLVRKSEHLKRLLDDLVEISKATTGNLEVDLTPCDAGVLINQVAGEFEERCRAADLELITSMPDTGIRIMADSRRIWRVFENLMNNACKYSLTGSRVYLTLTREGNEALFIFRNTSRTALNISPDELMERFVRGDTARSTEGNGLGLSIARSLTELQKGRMDIAIDGDLFKVTLSFPLL